MPISPPSSKPQKPSKQQRSRRSAPLIVEALEQRILYSADAGALLSANGLQTQQDGALVSSYVVPATSAAGMSQATQSSQSGSGTSSSDTQTESRREIVFIDSAIPNAQLLARQIANQSDTTRSVQVIIIDAGANGIKQITDALSQNQNLDAIHIISHGSNGQLQLGNSTLDSDSLLANAVAISKWGDALSSEGDILLYGCDVAADASGQAFVGSLAQLTGADISASVNLTGAAKLGGDWTLEYGVGYSETKIALDPVVQWEYQGVLATYTVTNTNNSGAGSLRQAITNANNNAGADTINFSIGSGTQVITLTSELPTITGSVMIDGSSQSGYSGAPLIVLSGASAGAGADGLTLMSGASGSTIKGLVINGFDNDGIYINGALNVTIQGNYIGTNAAGTSAVSNGMGIEIYNAANSNIVIGGTTASSRNIISGNGDAGILLDGTTSYVTVQGNYIGTDATGTSIIGQGTDGVRLEDSVHHITIGGTAAGARNVISGNDYGVNVSYTVNVVTIQGNYIGTDVTGTVALGNLADGVAIVDTSSAITVGGTAAGAGNVIANNARNGVRVDSGSTGNSILGNSIYANSGLGIDLNNNGVTANDAGDGDTGANRLQNFPVLTTANNNGTNTVIQGTLNSQASRTYRIEFFANDSKDASGNGEGKIYLGFVNVTTDGSGNAVISFTTSSASVGQWISATATDATTNDTSEFATDALVVLFNYAPAGTDKTIMTNEDTAYTFTAADFGFIDANNTPANSFLSVKITTLPGAGTLTNNGVVVVAGSFVLKSDIDAGKLKFMPAANGNGAGYASFTFQVRDNGGTTNGGVDLDPTARTITINVIAVNDAPAGTNKTVTTLEDSTYTFTVSDFGFTDGDGNALLAVKITTIPGAGTMTLSGVAVTAGQTITVANITAGNLKFTPAANANGTGYASFTFQVQDDGGTANSGIDLDPTARTMTINVTAVNDAPSGANKTVTVNEDNAYTFTVSDFGFTDSDGNTLLAVKIATNPGAGMLTLSGVAVTAGQTIAVANITAGNLKFTPAANGNGSSYASFTFQVQDNGGTANSGVDLDPTARTMTVNVTAVNDAPTGTNKTVATLEDTAYTFTVADFGFTDGDGNALLAVKITTVPGAGSLTLSGVAVIAGQTITVANITAGNLKFTPAVNANGAGYASFTFQVQDDGGTANSGADLDPTAKTMTVNVTSVNDAPSGANKTVTVNEDNTYTFSVSDFGFTDSDGNTLLAVKITTLPVEGSLTLNGVAVTAGQTISVANITAGNLKFTPAANANGAGYASFTFQVQDNGGTANSGVDLDSTARTMTVNVTAVNDAPSGANKTVTVNEDNAYTFTVSDFGFTDGDGNALLAVKITTIPGAGMLTLSGVAVTAGQTITVANITAGNLKFMPAANANGAGYANFTFQVQDNGGTANGGIDLDPIAKTMTVDVTAVNDAPAGANNTVTTQEDTAYIFTVSDFGFTDTIDSPANTLLAVKITTIPGAGSLTLNGIAVTAGQTITVANITAGNLKFAPAANANGAGYTSFTFQVQDNGGTANSGVDLDPTARAMTVNVTSVNDAPTGTNKTVTTLEDTAYTFTVSDFGFTDIDGNTLQAVKITTIPGAGTLTLSGVAVTAGQTITVANITAGNLKFTPAANANGAGYASFTFQVQDNGGTANSGVDLDPTARTMTVNVTAVNDAPTGTNKTVTTLEDTAYTFTVADFGFTDSEGNALLAVKITTIPGTGTLTLSGVAVTAGQTISVPNITAANLKFTPAANANGAGYASFTFQVQDDGGTTNSGVDLDPTARTMTVSVTSVNDAPAGANNTVTVNEDNAYTFMVSDFGFTDVDGNALLAVKITTIPGAGTLTLSGVAVTAGQTISVASITAGNLTFTPAASANGAGYASFTFQVQDDGGTANSGVELDPTARTMTVNVTSVNDAPSGANKTVTVNEDNAYTFTVSDFGFTDVDGNALLAVKITTIPGAGALTLNGVAVTAGQTITVANITAGNLKFMPVVNATGASYASFTFQVQDDGGTANSGVNLDSTARTMTVNVTAVNDAPAGANNTVITQEDTAYTFTVADFGFTDTSDSSANTLLAVKITTIPGTGTLTLSGVAVTAGQTITVANITAGNLKYTPGANANGAGYASFTFQVQDDGGTANSGVDLDPTARTMTVNVTSVNDAPSGANKTVTVNEDNTYTFTVSDFGFTDVDGNTLQAVKITMIPGAGTLTLSDVAVTAGQMITVADITAGNLKFTPAANANGAGYASFTFQVQDNGGTANSGVDLDPTARTMTVNVASVNDAPSGANKTVTVNEDNAYTFTVSDFGFTDVDGNSLLAVKITTIPGAGALTLNGVAVTAGQTITVANITAGNLKYTPAANANGAGYASFTFQVQDDGGTANSGVDLDPTARTMTVNVTSVNDAPAGANKTVTVNEDNAYTFTMSDFGFTDSDGNALLAVKITTLPGAGTLTLSGVAVTAGQTITVADITAGNLKFTPVANANGAGYASFTFQVQDNGGTANSGVDLDLTARTMTVNVTSINDAPSGANKTVTVNEDNAYTFTVSDFGFTDVDGNALLAVKITTIPGAGTLTLSGVAVTAGQTITVANITAGNFKFTPAANTNGAGYASFTFQVQDDGGTANGGADLDPSAKTMTVNVTSVNDAPSGANNTVTVNEDTAYTFTVSDFVFTDVDGNALQAVKITTIPAAGSLTLNGVAVTAGQTISVANITSGNLKFTPAANANGAGYASFTFQVQDDGGTANSGVDLDATARTMTVDVTSVNDAPSGANKTVTTLEDTAYTFTVADFGFTDTDSNALHAVKITTIQSAATLTLNGVAVIAGQMITVADITAGNLKFTPAANANGAGYASFTFQVQDDGGTTNSGVDIDPTARTMTVNVTAINDAPAGANKTVTVNEDNAYTFTVSDFGFTDSADGNALQAVKIATIPVAGSLTLNGVAVTVGQIISVADVSAGNLRFTPAANANGAGYASFTFQVQDDGGVSSGGIDTDPTPKTMTVNVTSVNDAPTGTNKTITTLEDNTYTFTVADFGFTDTADGNALQAVKVTTIPGAGTLTLNGVAVTAGQTIAVASITAGDLKFAPTTNANGASYASFMFQVQDDGGTANSGVDRDPTARTMTVNVTSVNDAPIGANKTVTAYEDNAYTFTVSDFGFTDADGNSLHAVRVTTIPVTGSITLNSVAVTAGQTISVAELIAGNLKFTPAANANGVGYASFTFQVQDNGGTANGGVDIDPAAKTMTVNVTSVNDAPTGADKTVTVNEDNAYTFAVSDFGFTDVDGNALQAVKIATIPVAGFLTLNGVAVTAGQAIGVADIAAGNLKFTPAANANGAGYASFTFQVQDDGSTANSGVDLDPTARTMTVNVTAVNDAPTGTNKTFTTLEDTAYTFTVSDFGFTDSDGNVLHAVKITTIPVAGALTLNGVAVTAGQTISVANITAGNLKFTPAANANGAGYASFTFQVQDDGGTANGGADLDPSAETMTVNVTSANDAPAGANKTVTVNEDNAYTFTVSDFGFTDIDGNALLAVKITTIPGAGTLTLSGIAVTAGQAISVANITAGNLKFTPAANANGAGYASFTFQVQDDGGTANGGVDLDPTARTMTVNVTSVNDAPSGTNKTVTVNEDNAYTFTVSDFGFTDSDGNALLAVKITTVPGAGSLTLSGVAVTAGQMISVADVTASNLKFTPAANANGASYVSFTFQVQDDGGTANGGVDLDTTARTMTVDVTGVNDAPSGANKTVTVNEDNVYTFTVSDFGFADISDSPANTVQAVKITTIPGAGSLTLNGVAVTAGQTITVADINAGKLKFMPVANANGASYASFTFQVQDDGGTANGGVDLDPTAKTMTVNVTSVNDAPSGANKTITVNEDNTYTFSVSDFGFTDSDGNALQAVKITTIPGNGSLTLNGVAVIAGQTISIADISGGNLKFTPAADANGTGYASFTFQVQDDGGIVNGGVDLDPTAKTMTVNVTAVNDAPAGANRTVTTLEDTAYTFTVSDFGFTDSDGNALQAVKITTIPGAGSLTLNGVAVTAGQTISVANITAGNLKFTPAANANGTGYASFTFQIQDDGGTTNSGVDLDPTARTIIVNVTSVNDAPAGANNTVTTLEDTAYTFTVSDFGFTDADGNALQAVKITTIPAAGTLTLNGVSVTAGQTISVATITAGNLKFTPAANANGAGYASFTFQVQDDGGTTNSGVDLDATPRTMTVNVTNVNDAPTGTNKTVATPENTAYTFTVSDFGFTDAADGNALQTVKITTIPVAGSLTLNGVAVTADQTITATDITTGNLKFTPAANAYGLGYASFTFQVRDNGGTANGGVDLDPTARTMTVNVTSVNGAPVGTNKTVTVNEDNAYTFTVADFGFTDADGNTLQAVKVTTIPGVGTLTLNGVAVTTGQMISVANITAGNLKFAPFANSNGAGYASFTFQVQDDGGTANGGVDLDTTARTMTLNVTSVNDAPSGANKTVAVNEDNAYTFTVSDFGFTDSIDGNVLQAIKITTAPGAGSLALNGVAVTAGQSISVADITAGNLKFTSAANASGAGYASFTFQVQDDGGTANGGVDLDTTARTMTLNVTSVNDAPSGANKTVVVNEDAAYTFTVSDFGFSDSDGNALQAVTITTIPGAGSVTLNGVAVTAGQTITVANITAGNLKFTPAANANGAGYASFTFHVQDDGGTANGGVDLDPTARTMTVNVTSINDAPRGANKTVIVNEDNAYTFTVADFGFTDSDGNALQAVKIATIPVAGSLTLSGVTVTAGQTISVADITAGNLKFTPAANANGAGYGSFTFQVQDDGGVANGGNDIDPTTRAMTVNVASVNDAPSGANKTVAVNEDNAYTFTVPDFGFTDVDGNVLQAVKITTIPIAGFLTLNGVAVTAGQMIGVASITAGNLKFTPAANANGAGYASFTFQVQDDGGTASSGVDLDPSAKTMTVNVTSVNDAPSGTNKTVTINEDNAYTFTVSDFGFMDADGNTLQAVKITTIPGAGTLTLSGVAVTAGQTISVADITAGNLKFIPAANANGAAYASFTFQVQDDGGTADSGVDLDPTAKTMTVNITGVNDAPSGTNKTVTVNEDNAYTFTVSDFGFTDSDGNALLAVKITIIPGAGSLTLSGVAVTAGQMISVADITAGNLKFTPAANANGAVYTSFTFQVQDDGGTANGGVDFDPTPRTMTVNVTGVNDAPSGTNKTVTVNEDNTYTFTVSDFGFSDSDGYTLFSVKITTTPGAGSFTLNGVAVTAGQAISVADITAGNLKFTPAANANGASYASFTFQVQDDGGTANGGVDLDPTAKTMTVNVTSVNDAPSGTNKTVTLKEDNTYTFTVSDFGFSDSDGNALSAIKITTILGAGALTLNGVAVTAGQTVSVADITVGNLKFTPAANANAAGYASFTFQVQDNGGAANGGVDLDPTAKAMTVNVTSVNDAPTGANNTVTTLEDTAYTFTVTDFGFTDSDGNALQAVKITTIPAAGTLTLNGVAVTAGQTITVANITLGNLKFTPAANANGTSYTSFTFQVQDNGGTTNGGVDLDPTARTMTVNVTSVNDAPAGANKTVTTNEDTAYTFTVADFGFTDSDGNALQAVKITTIPTAGILTLNGVAVTAGQTISVANITAGNLKFTPAANANGAGYASFTFQVQDDGGTTNSGIDLDPTARTMTVNVTSVNDAPSGTNKTVVTNENNVYTFTVSDFSFSDSDGNTLQAVKIATIPGAGSLTLSGVAVTAGQTISVADITAGNLKFTPAANTSGNGYASVGIQVQDNGGSANGGLDTDPTVRTITINVRAVNHAPTGTDYVVTVLEDHSYIISAADLGFSDIDGDTLLAVKISTLPTVGSLTLNGIAVTAGQFISAADISAGNLKFTPAANSSGASYASFTFQVRDNGGTAGGGIDTDLTARSLTVNVTSVNDAPVGTSKTINMLEDTAYTFTAADFGFSDTDGNTLQAVFITSMPGAGTLLWNGTAFSAGNYVWKTDIDAGLLKFIPATNGNGSGYSSFTFKVQDNGGTANGGMDTDVTARTLTINVTNVNDAPVGNGRTMSVQQGNSYSFAVADFGFSDIDGDSLQAVRITTIPTNGNLLLNGTSVNNGQYINIADIVAGKLVFTTSLGNAGTAYGSFTFQVQDKGGIANGGINLDGTARSMTINVSEVPKAPINTNPAPGTPAVEPSQKPSVNGNDSTKDAAGGTKSTTTVTGSDMQSSKASAINVNLPAVQIEAGGFGLKAPAVGVQALVTSSPSLGTANDAGTGKAGIGGIFGFGSLNLQQTLQGKAGSTSVPTIEMHSTDAGGAKGGQGGQQNDGIPITGAVLPQTIELATAMTALGTVWLISRKTALLASLLATVPSWVRLDPLPVLGGPGENLDEEGMEEDEDDISDHIFSEPQGPINIFRGKGKS